MENTAEIEKIISNYISEVSERQTEDSLRLMIKHLEILLQENKKYNLTAITDFDEALERHILDSIILVKLCPSYFEKSKKIVDIGSGGGFPGIPVAILFPSKNITLVESIEKKTNFLNLVKNTLRLDNIEVIKDRAENISKILSHKNCYDIAISRALGNLEKVLQFSLPFLKTGGICIAMKGTKVTEEIKSVKPLLKKTKSEIIDIIPYSLITPMNLRLVLIKKISL